MYIAMQSSTAVWAETQGDAVPLQRLIIQTVLSGLTQSRQGSATAAQVQARRAPAITCSGRNTAQGLDWRDRSSASEPKDKMPETGRPSTTPPTPHRHGSMAELRDGVT